MKRLNHKKSLKNQLPLLLSTAEKTLTGIPFGIPVLDELGTVSLSKGTLSILLAASNVGKSWFCVNSACNAMERGKDVLFITLEMASCFVAQRIVSNLTGSPLESSAEQMKKNWEAVMDETFGEFVLEELPPHSTKPDDIRQTITEYMESCGKFPDLVIVDGLSDIAMERGESSYEGYGVATAALCNISREFDLAVLTTCQSNRESFKEGLEVLRATHIADSLKIFQRADTVLSLAPRKGVRNSVILSIVKARLGQKDASFEIRQDLAKGQFCLD